MPVIQDKEQIYVNNSGGQKIIKKHRNLYLGDVTYGDKELSKRVLVDYSKRVLEKSRILLFDENIRSEHKLANCYDEYKIVFEDGHIARFANYEAYDFAKAICIEQKKLEKINKELPDIQTHILNKRQNQRDIEMM